VRQGLDRFFFYPDARDRGTPSDLRLPYEDVFFDSTDGCRLHGWFLPAADRPAKDATATILHLHGNAANITGHYHFVRWLPAAGCNVLAFDYRGYGRSDGRVTRRGMFDDALAALDYLRTRRDVTPGRLVVFGQSIGGTIAASLLAERAEMVQAAVIDSAFSGFRGIAGHHVLRQPLLLLVAWWYPLLVSDALNAVEAIAQVRDVPTLLIHGKTDRITPWKMSVELYDAAHEPKSLWLVEGMDHTEVWEVDPHSAQQRFMAFIEDALRSAGDERRSPPPLREMPVADARDAVR